MRAVLVYGQLNAPPVADQTIIIYHHVVGGKPGYSRVAKTHNRRTRVL